MKSRIIYVILAFISIISVKVAYFFASMLIAIWEIFLNIFLKILSWVRDRPFISIRISEKGRNEALEACIENEPDNGIGHLQFEVENQSNSAVSLMPQIKATFWHPVKGKYVKASTIFYVRELDRTLAPFTPRILSATAKNLPRGFGFSWFRTYKFYPTRGFGTKVRLRNAFLERMNSFQYALAMIKFRTKRDVKTYNLISMDEFAAKRHLRGPHQRNIHRMQEHSRKSA